MTTVQLQLEPLRADTFAPFGDVITTDGAENYQINGGRCTRFHDLAKIDAASEGGRPLINIFRCTAWPMPLQVKMLEKHTLGSQAFIPMGDIRFLAIVAPPGDSVQRDSVRAFVSDGHRGVNYHAGVWHHPLVALAAEADFLVVDRGGQSMDCIEHHFKDDQWLGVSSEGY